MEGKVCSKCKEFKLYNQFNKKKSIKDGYASACKECRKIENANSFKKNKEKRMANQKEYYEKNKDSILLKCKEYREENKEKIAEYKKAWAITNKDKKVKQEKEWRENNKEKNKETMKRWYSFNRDKIYSNTLKRRSLKYKVHFSPLQRTKILERDKYTCQKCKVKVHDRKKGDWNDEFKAHIDHIVPISKGGDSTPENLRVLCRTCNLRKSDKLE